MICCKSQYQFYGADETIDQFVETLPFDLTDDTVGLWKAVPFGMYRYDLSGDALKAFLKRCLLAIMAKGGKPLEPATDGIHGWQVATRYGARPDDIADAILAEWEAAGSPVPKWGEWAFGLDHTINRKIGGW